MDAVVPAAGRGTRLRPLTDDRPKPLVEVAGRPLLAHVFDALAPAGPDRYVVVIGHEGDAIRERFGASYRDVPIEYVRQERQLGLAHAVRQAADVVEGSCLVCNGDNVFADSLASLWTTHAERTAATDAGPTAATDADYAATILVEEATRERASRVGAVVTDGDGPDGTDSGGDGSAERVERVVEKAADPPTTLVSAGAYAFEPTIFEASSAVEPADTGEYELADAVTWLVDRGRAVGVHRHEGERVNVNEPDDVERAARLVDGVRSDGE